MPEHVLISKALLREVIYATEHDKPAQAWVLAELIKLHATPIPPEH